MPIQRIRNANKHMVVVIELHGEIGKTITFDSTKDLIDEAFKVHSIDSIVLEINSPGGSPQVTEQIVSYINEKSKLNNIEVFSFITDQALSGGYWVACAGQEIYAGGKLSSVGSIGVRIDTVHFRKFMERLGIEMKTIVSGEKKVFSDQSDDDIQSLAGQIHEVFKSSVKSSRGDRLNIKSGEDPFNGDMWMAEEALEMGLIDGITTFDSFVESKFGDKAKVVRVKESVFKLDLSDIIMNAFKKFK